MQSPIETERRRISTPNGDYVEVIQNYRFDIVSKGEKETVIDFSLRMDLIPKSGRNLPIKRIGKHDLKTFDADHIGQTL